MPETFATEARKERLTRRGEIAFLAMGVVFWIGVIYFFGPVLKSGHHREQLTPTFYAFGVLIFFAIVMIVILVWLLLLAIVEAEEVTRSEDGLHVTYFLFGRRHLRDVSRDSIRKVPVRLFRFHVENNFEPAWLLPLGGLRLVVIPRARVDSSL